MNAKEFAEIIGVNEKTVRNRIKRGEIKAKKCGKAFVIDEKQGKQLIKKKSNKKMYKQYKIYIMDEIIEINLRKKELQLIIENMNKRKQELQLKIENMNERV